ncbi:hypothetical protein N7468_005934 [Penicillium chermesinum]|uniref:Uncharacterized protein n=1 Tax=Penicillium chermesinum TaxID=63820 RepID=A0A9W9P2T5_9EURO|nr:uncharacterized protein N7468_005934 [Penicillium chermesinum]KAJ5232978.1 hypothetical protein N7468_005934 [Penicillium chermesinum]
MSCTVTRPLQMTPYESGPAAGFQHPCDSIKVTLTIINLSLLRGRLKAPSSDAIVRDPWAKPAKRCPNR